jgi:hypothetical protein
MEDFNRAFFTLNDQVKEDEMGMSCGTHGREKEYIQGFGGGRKITL